MRTKKELLMILRKYTEDYIPEYGYGLCGVIMYLRAYRTITGKEKYVLLQMIHDNKPDPQHDALYWWKPGELAPRLEFLNKLIAECDEKI